jgi:hypothetical protein
MNTDDPTNSVCASKKRTSAPKEKEVGASCAADNPPKKDRSAIVKRARNMCEEDEWSECLQQTDDMVEDEESRALIEQLQNEEMGAFGGAQANWVRRSGRACGSSGLSARQLKEVIDKIKTNHPEAVVLKLKDHLGADTNSSVMEAVLRALAVNTNCQALYIQNFSEALRDPQLKQLAKVLAKGRIWCLNIGETYQVSPGAWERFASALAHTHVTHMYASEHTISAELKTRFRDVIRENRCKHDRHISMDNLAVIERCTNM